MFAAVMVTHISEFANVSTQYFNWEKMMSYQISPAQIES